MNSIPEETIESINKCLMLMTIALFEKNTLECANNLNEINELVKPLKLHYKKRQHLFDQFVRIVEPFREVDFPIYFGLLLRNA